MVYTAQEPSITRLNYPLRQQHISSYESTIASLEPQAFQV